MIVKRTIWVLAGVLLLITAAAAIDLSSSNISNSNTGWLVANNLDSTTITVYANNATAGPNVPLAGATVDFWVDPASAGMGGIASPVSVTTGTDGKAVAIFRTAMKSGIANIHANVSFNDGLTNPVTLTTTQNVDHSVPTFAFYNYTNAVPVGNTTTVRVKLIDMWGNPVDSNNPSDIHNVILATTNSPGGEGFFNGSSYVDTIVLHPDATGTVTTTYRVSTAAGVNTFILQPIGYLSAVPQYILGIGESNPAYIEMIPVIPQNPLPTNGNPNNYFTLDYMVTDAYGNPANTSLLITAADGSSNLIPTNPFNGKVRAFFGPKTIIGDYVITASAPANASVQCTVGGIPVASCKQTVSYYSDEPVDMSLNANPPGMASLDADPTAKSTIQAKVIDIMGNPVAGQDVTFSLGTPDYPGGPYNVTSGPTISSGTAKVTNGYATITFTPGAFVTYPTPGYNASATGEVVLTASWTNKTHSAVRNVTLVWKNYPYLSLASNANCVGVEVGKAVNITLSVSGDGAALAPKPIDAMMIFDDSGSMNDSTSLMNGPNGSQSKMYYAKVAGSTFVSKMNSATDQIGLIDFNNNPTLDYSISGNFVNVTNKLKTLTSGGSTSTRYALKMGIGDIKAHSTNPKAIRAIILLTDGAYNNYGDPLARANNSYRYNYTPPSGPGTLVTEQNGTWQWNRFSDLTASEQNLENYAKENNIRVYIVTLGSKTQDPVIQQDCVNMSNRWQIYDTMDQLSIPTGGQHFHATDGNQLIDVYTTIAGLLRDTAGGQTFVDTDFGTLNINNNPYDKNGSSYLSYVYYHNATLGYNPSDSTYTNMTKMDNAGIRTLEYQNVSDDSGKWPNLTFNVGTVKLNETYTINFRVNFTKIGMITLFDPLSSSGNTVTFIDSVTNTTQIERFEPVYCNAIAQGPGTHGYANFTISQPVAPVGEFTTSLPIQWTTTYNSSPGSAYEMVQIADSSIGQTFQSIPGSYINIPPNVLERPDSYIIDTSDDVKYQPGDNFCVQIWGYSENVTGTPTSLQTCRKKAGSGAGQYIKLE